MSCWRAPCRSGPRRRGGLSTSISTKCRPRCRPSTAQCRPLLRSVVEKALAKWPEDRFQTASELARALERAQAAPSRRLYPPPPPPPPAGVGEGAPEPAAADKSRNRSRNTPRPVEDRTDMLVIPGRGVTGAGYTPPTTRRGSAVPWLLGTAVALLVGVVVLVATGIVDVGGSRLAAQPAPATTATLQAFATSALAAVPATTRTPGSSQPATVRTAVPVVVLTTPPTATAPGGVATAAF